MTDSTCVICDGALTGKQTKFCSKVCAGKAAYEWQLSTGYRTGRGRDKRKAWMDANRTRLEERATEERECTRCGQRYTTRFGPQRFCSHACFTESCRAPMLDNVCQWCGDGFDAPLKNGRPRVFCSLTCLRTSNRYLTRPPASTLGPVRLALDAEDWPALIEALRTKTTLTAQGCWEWAGRMDKSGYGRVIVSGKAGRSTGSTQLVHRVMARAMLGAVVPSHLPVHHKCANAKCINPDHLQIVQPHENNAEMLERTYYLRRIAELEAELAALRTRAA